MFWQAEVALFAAFGGDARHHSAILLAKVP
jgi:hypothetical protein